DALGAGGQDLLLGRGVVGEGPARRAAAQVGGDADQAQVLGAALERGAEPAGAATASSASERVPAASSPKGTPARALSELASALAPGRPSRESPSAAA